MDFTFAGVEGTQGLSLSPSCTVIIIIIIFPIVNIICADCKMLKLLDINEIESKSLLNSTP